MSIAVTCSACGRTFSVKDKYAGSFGSCPYCSSALRVPKFPAKDSTEILDEEVEHSGASLLNSVEIVACPNCRQRNIKGVPSCVHCGLALK